MSTSVAARRRDLHNTSINFTEAIAGRCGFTHVASGRVCRFPERHAGPCDLRDTDRRRRRSHDATPSRYEEHS
jgi:hypothetical protein